MSMSSRRAARGRLASRSGTDGGMPLELGSQLHPLWRDPQAVARAFPEYVKPEDLIPLRVRLLYHRVLDRWAVAHGYADAHGCVDWHALRAGEPLLRRPQPGP